MDAPVAAHTLSIVTVLNEYVLETQSSLKRTVVSSMLAATC